MDGGFSEYFGPMEAGENKALSEPPDVGGFPLLRSEALETLSGALVKRKGRDAGFSEGAPSNASGHGFVRSPRRPARSAHETPRRARVRRAPCGGRKAVVPEGEVLRAEPFEMIEALKKRHAPEPLDLEGLDGALRDGDGAMLATAPKRCMML